MTSPSDPRRPGRHVPPDRRTASADLPSPRARPLPERGEPAGFALARHTVVTVLAISVCRFLGLSVAPGCAVLVAVLLWAMMPAGMGTALFAAVESWSLGTGFLVNRSGELSFSPTDRGRLVLFVVLVSAMVLIGWWRRAVSLVDRDGVGDG